MKKVSAALGVVMCFAAVAMLSQTTVTAPSDHLGVVMPRSGHWPAVRAEHLKRFPTCAACGNADLSILEVHHVLDFHEHPERELDPENLISLCSIRGGCKGHFRIGHSNNYQRPANPKVREDAAAELAARKKGMFP